MYFFALIGITTVLMVLTILGWGAILFIRVWWAWRQEDKHECN
jgi:hypothetical protein